MFIGTKDVLVVATACIVKEVVHYGGRITISEKYYKRKEVKIMNELIRFFRKLHGEHLHKKQEVPGKIAADSIPSLEGIDCCDVTDTCCDSYD